jgi:hypothetical protein
MFHSAVPTQSAPNVQPAASQVTSLPSETERKRTLAFVDSWHDEPAWMVPTDEVVEYTLPALIDQTRAALEPSDPAEVLVALMTWADRRGHALPTGAALDFDVEILASWPRDLFRLAYRRCWESFAYRRMPEVADFKRLIDDELAERQSRLMRLTALQMKMETARLRRQWNAEATERQRQQRDAERVRGCAALEKTASHPELVGRPPSRLSGHPNPVEISDDQLGSPEHHPELPLQAPDSSGRLTQKPSHGIGRVKRAVPFAQAPLPAQRDAMQRVEPLEFELGCPGQAAPEPGIVRPGAELTSQTLAHPVLDQHRGESQPEVAQPGGSVEERAGEDTRRGEGRPLLPLAEPDQRDGLGPLYLDPMAPSEIQALGVKDPVVGLDHPDEAGGCQIGGNAVKRNLDMIALFSGQSRHAASGGVNLIEREQILDLWHRPEGDRPPGVEDQRRTVASSGQKGFEIAHCGLRHIDGVAERFRSVGYGLARWNIETDGALQTLLKSRQGVAQARSASTNRDTSRRDRGPPIVRQRAAVVSAWMRIRRLSTYRCRVPRPVVPVTSATTASRVNSSSIPEASSTMQLSARASTLTLSSGEAASTSTAWDSRDVDRLPRHRDTAVCAAPIAFHRPQQAEGVLHLPGYCLQKPGREPSGIIKLSRPQRVAAGQRRQRLARGATLLEVKGQGGADRGPACHPSQCSRAVPVPCRSAPVASPRPAEGGPNPCRVDPAQRDLAGLPRSAARPRRRGRRCHLPALGQGQGGADPERQAVRERGEPVEIALAPSTLA